MASGLVLHSLPMSQVSLPMYLPKLGLNWVNCVVPICLLGLFLTVPWVGLQSEIVSFPSHFELNLNTKLFRT